MARASQSSSKLGAASFYGTPRLTLNPNSGTVGSTAAIHGYGFGATEQVNFTWKNPLTKVTTATANVDGSFSVSFTVPTAPPGRNAVVAQGQQTGASASATFTVH